MPDLSESAHSSGGSGLTTGGVVVGLWGGEKTAPEPLVTTSPPHHLTTPLLLFQHVSKWYGAVIGVNQVTLELSSGITGLVGANGAGKSTLLRLATGQL